MINKSRLVCAFGAALLGIWLGMILIPPFAEVGGSVAPPSLPKGLILLATEEAKLTDAMSPNLQDRFGWTVAVSGDTAVVGTPFDNSGQGAALVFTRSGMTWSLQQRLVASDPMNNDQFGWAVAIDGDTIAVGARLVDVTVGMTTILNQGAVYVFTRSGGVWTQQQKLLETVGGTNQFFGQAVDVDGDSLIAGTFPKKQAYVFTRSGGVWTQQQTLMPTPDTNSFGNSVAIEGDTAIVGAPTASLDSNFNEEGAAYVFVRSAGVWTQQQMLTSPSPDVSAEFGISVGISGQSVIVGAPVDNNGAPFTGAAYVFTRSGVTWSLQQRITPSDGATADRFGQAAAIDGDRAVVGANNDDVVMMNDNQGSAYLYERSGGVWGSEEKLVGSDSAANDEFGNAVAIDGCTAIIGAALHDLMPNMDEGTAYVFVGMCTPTPMPTGCVNGNINAIAVDGSGNVYVGGTFTEIDGVPANHIALWNGATWSALGDGSALANNGVNGNVNALAISGNMLYVGGQFTQAQSSAVTTVPASRVAAWNIMSSTWSVLGSAATVNDNGVNNSVNALAVNGSNLYVGGFFTEARTNAGTKPPTSRVAMWNGSAWSALGDGSNLNNNGTSNPVTALAIDGMGNVFAGGNFPTARNGAGMTVAVNRIARWNGAMWSALGTGLAGGGVNAIAIDASNNVFIGFASSNLNVGGVPASRVAMWNGSSWSALGDGSNAANNGVDFDVTALTISSSNLYVGGRFQQARNSGVSTVATSRIAMWNGTSWSALGDGSAVANNGVANAGNNPAVLALATGGGNLYVGGFFTQVRNSAISTVNAGNLAGWNGTTWAALGLGSICNVAPPPVCMITCSANVTQNNDMGQCGAVVNYSNPTTSGGGCGTVSCAPPTGSFFPVGLTTVTCTTTAGPLCSFTVTVNDTESPAITCPPNQIGIAGVINYPAPMASDNCPLAMGAVVCVPPSGSVFPLGTTTVACTVTDMGGNQAQCSFTVQTFDLCLQHDSNASVVLLINSVTGDYLFCCAGQTVSGKGTISKKGTTYTLTHNTATHRVQASVTVGGLNKGTASLQMPVGTVKCSITDRNISDNTCACSP